jgi:hypothetical protein
MSGTLAERVLVLRDEVLDTARVGDEEPPGVELFEAILRWLESASPSDDDAALHDAIARRLAWGEAESKLLTDYERTCKRLVEAAERSLRQSDEAAVVITAAAEVGCAAAKMVALAAVNRAERERAGQVREEQAQARLQRALERQREEIRRLEEELARARRR